jgi:Alternative oxidase
MHSGVFTDAEIVELSEIYYSGKGGGSVRFDNFIEAADLVAAKSAATKAALANGDSIPKHFLEGERHPLGLGRESLEFMHLGEHRGVYTAEELDVQLTHVEPVTFADKAAYNAVKLVRFVFDAATGWRMDNIKVGNTLNRVIYLETIAAVPGMVAAVCRHLSSLRNMKTDGGMMQLFLEEANNERSVLDLLQFMSWLENVGSFSHLTASNCLFFFVALPVATPKRLCFFWKGCICLHLSE